MCRRFRSRFGGPISKALAGPSSEADVGHQNSLVPSSALKCDGVEALKWAILAARQGHREAKENRALLKKRLSAEQISKAEQLADLF